MNNFYPIDLKKLNDDIFFILRFLPQDSFTHPNLEALTHSMTKNDVRNTKLISLSALEATLDQSKYKLPTGIIFHVTRCGSTILGQVLSEVNATRVVSEPGILGIITKKMMAGEISNHEANRSLLVVFKLFGQSEPLIQNYIVKVQSFANDLIPHITTILPDTPWIFLIRKPREVILSQIKNTTIYVQQMFDKRQVLEVKLGRAFRTDTQLRKEEIVALLIGKWVKLILASRNDKLQIVSYENFPNVIFSKILIHLNINLSAANRRDVENRLKFRGMGPKDLFEKENKSQSEITTSIKRAADIATLYFDQLS